MSEKIFLKDITLPITETGEDETYYFVQTDSDLNTAGDAADAKKVGDELTDIKGDISQLENVQSNAFIEKTASGNIATFSDAASVPVVSLIAKINPSQSGSGDPSPTNVRPISGYTGINIYHSGSDTDTYNTVTIDWEDAAGTVYAGTLDVISGLLTVTHASVDMSTLAWGIHTFHDIDYYSVVISAAKPGVTNKMGNTYCDSYKIIKSAGVTSAEFVDGTLFILAAGTVYLRNSAYSSADALKASLVGRYLVYELKNYQTYNLTPVQITALLGENNIWHNCNGNTDVAYCVNTDLWGQELQADVYGKVDSLRLLLGKKITLIGDSITGYNGRASTNYGMWLTEWDGCIIQNLGVSGTGFKRGEPYNYKPRINNVNADVDIIGVAASFNDMHYDVGTPTDTVSDGTVCGYANDFFDALITAFPTKRIVCYCQGPWETYRPGITKSDDYMAAMKTICENKGVVWNDSLYRGCALRPWLQTNREVYYVGEWGDLEGVVDNTHPNSAGHQIIARVIEKLFETVVDGTN